MQNVELQLFDNHLHSVGADLHLQARGRFVLILAAEVFEFFSETVILQKVQRYVENFSLAIGL